MTMNMRLRHLMTAFLAATFLFYPCGNAKDDDCACTAKGIRLHGRGKVIDAFPDLKVKVVETFPDLRVKIVEHFPDDFATYCWEELGLKKAKVRELMTAYNYLRACLRT